VVNQGTSDGYALPLSPESSLDVRYAVRQIDGGQRFFCHLVTLRKPTRHISTATPHCARQWPAPEDECLKYKSDFLIAYARQFIVIHLGNVLAVKPILACDGVSRQPIRFIKVDLPEPEGL